MMNKIKFDRVYVKTMEGSIEHFKDAFGNHWYNYRDLCQEVLIPDRERADIFYRWLNENEVQEIQSERSLVKFVSAEGFRRIITRNFQRGMDIYKDLINFEFRGDEFDELKYKFNDLEHAILKGDVMNMFNGIESIHSDMNYKQAVCKYNPNMDLGIEMVVENIRYEMYNDSTDEILLKRNNCEEYAFKKNKNPNKKTQVPSWIREVVK